MRVLSASLTDQVPKLAANALAAAPLLFVSPEAHGSGVAAALIADAEAMLAEHGVETAWLACAVGNNRAARFYEKSGWCLAGTFVNSAETSSGPFSLEAWRYEKRLARLNSVSPELIRGK